MIESDTVKLLRECVSGIKMGISGLEEVLPKAKNEKLKDELLQCMNSHIELEQDAAAMLHNYGDEEKEPPLMVKAMSKMKTGVKLTLEDKDETIADVIIDGCNMGVKSLSRYLNQYKAADESSKDLTKRLITLEEDLSKDLRPFL